MTSFLLRKATQIEANNPVYQRYAGLFRFPDIAKERIRKQVTKVLNRGTWVRVVKMYHANGDNALNDIGLLQTFRAFQS